MGISIEKSVFGKMPDGKEVALYTMKNSKGMEVAVSELGAAIVSLKVPDAQGEIADVVLGFDTVEQYLINPSFFGVVVGPSANRIGNAKFEIEGVTYTVDANDNKINNLHSHIMKGYHKVLWTGTVIENGVALTFADEDGYLGFPGNKQTTVEYTLDEENNLKLHYTASSDKKTILNPTNHTYFNLDGHTSGNIEGHKLQIAASNYTPTDAFSIPTGEIAPVAGTPMDFTVSKVIGNDIDADFEQLKFALGFDHNWALDGYNGELHKIAEVEAAKSSRVMKVFTTLPGVQFYAGNCIIDQTGKGGAAYAKRSGLCLETQYYPDTINKPQFPGGVFDGASQYESVTVYQFGNK